MSLLCLFITIERPKMSYFTKHFILYLNLVEKLVSLVCFRFCQCFQNFYRWEDFRLFASLLAVIHSSKQSLPHPEKAASTVLDEKPCLPPWAETWCLWWVPRKTYSARPSITFSVFCVTLALKKIPVKGFPNIKERKNGVLVVELKYVQNLATANVLLTSKYRYCANGFYGAGEVVLKLGHNF